MYRNAYALRKRDNQRLLFITFIMLLSIGIFYSNIIIYRTGQKLTVSAIDSLTPADAVIALGSKVYKNDKISSVFQDRLDTAFAVYHSGKAAKILISGDHGQQSYDEVNTGKHYLLAKGVKPADLFLDHAGFDTFDSMYRARTIFNIKTLIITTQQSHLPRALYLADRLGIQAQGFSSNAHIYHKSLQVHQFIRERIANVKATLNIILHAQPKFLGKVVDIHGDGEKSWD